MIRKRSLLVGICILLLAGASAFAAYLIFDSGVYRISSRIPADWPTYRKYGFEFKYPAGWDLEIARGYDTPLVLYLRPLPPQPGEPEIPGIEIEIRTPYESVAAKVAAYKTLGAFKSEFVFRTAYVTGRRVLLSDRASSNGVPIYFFTRPGTSTVFMVGVTDGTRSSPEIYRTLEMVLASFRFF